MSPADRRAYDNYLDTLVRDTDVMKTKLLEAEITGRKKGMEEGRAEGRAEEKLANARSLKANGVPIDMIAKSLGLTSEEIEIL